MGKVDQKGMADQIRERSPNMQQSSRVYDPCYSYTPHVGPPYHPLAENRSNRYVLCSVIHETCSCYKLRPIGQVLRHDGGQKSKMKRQEKELQEQRQVW